jgi:predicted cupin superfamily sugar epimerase
MPDPHLTGDDVIEILGLEPLPDEGGMFRRAWGSDYGSAIYFLLRPNDFSAFHRLTGPELWHYYGGDPARLILISEAGELARLTLGMDLRAGERPLHVVEPGTWMAAETTGQWTLLGTTMAPSFDVAEFELGRREDLLRLCPAAADEVVRLTRPDPSRGG